MLLISHCFVFVGLRISVAPPDDDCMIMDEAENDKKEQEVQRRNKIAALYDQQYTAYISQQRTELTQQHHALETERNKLKQQQAKKQEEIAQATHRIQQERAKLKAESNTLEQQKVALANNSAQLSQDFREELMRQEQLVGERAAALEAEERSLQQEKATFALNCTQQSEKMNEEWMRREQLIAERDSALQAKEANLQSQFRTQQEQMGEHWSRIEAEQTILEQSKVQLVNEQSVVAQNQQSLEKRERELRQQIEAGTFEGSKEAGAGKKRRYVVPVKSGEEEPAWFVAEKEGGPTEKETTNSEWVAIAQQLQEQTSFEQRGQIVTQISKVEEKEEDEDEDEEEV